MVRIENGAVDGVEESLFKFFAGRGKGDFICVFVIEVEGLFWRPVEVVFVLLPFSADFSGSLEYCGEGFKAVGPCDVDAGGAQGPVHCNLLGGAFDVPVDCFCIDFLEQCVAYEAAGQLDVVHQSWGIGDGTQQIGVADDRNVDVVFAEVLEKFE